MTITSEVTLAEFDFWSGARDTVADLTHDEINMFEEYISIEGEPVSETAVNDFFWFERELIAETLGYTDYDELMEDRR